MKNTSLILNLVLAVAVIGIYALHFSGKNSKEVVAEKSSSVSSSDGLKIAYVKVDSLIVNYDLAQELHDNFTKNQEAYTKEYTEKRSSFEKRAAAFQEKVQRGGFLTQDRAIQERDRLVSEEQEVLTLDQELSTKLSEMQAANNQQLIDSLMSYLEEFNADQKYNYILNSGDVLIGDEAHNITKEVLEVLNSRYNSNKK
ncbi:OmpH family outer membrane protein [Sunxiuqinia elliptica]|uniref:Outer membrane protein n=1 Tax=Sunxiuqinia elliptica TaxID=655355 RepID=A0A1I2EPU2_9BACT|nr:OmpH family outer membrane protein [Sunxiuqinia elliptica]TDO04872.1 periplasmic chaperone for outer membrane proteins Skp [Sunxiuqinia elliptica]TDO64420.1 periplasmic chaperone for outer membrane proteins Skp [Sunxiuqinia elliptica]SFE94240.1 outer membrane protein [Sunxiuqinia elliptica]